MHVTGTFIGIGRVSGYELAYVRWSDGTVGEFSLSGFKKAFGVRAKSLATDSTVHRVPQEQETLVNEAPLSANDFIAAVQSQTQLRTGRLATPSFSDGRVFVTFVHDAGKLGLTIEGFDQNPSKPANGGVWSSRSKPGDVKVETRHSDFSAKVRSKFGSPQVIARYIADELARISNEVSQENVMEEAGHPNRKRLGEMMQHWHSGQGDPIYAVGSYYYSGKPYPDPVVVERALDWFESVTGQDARAAREVRSIEAGLRYFLKHDYPGHQAVVHEAGGSYRGHWFLVGLQDFRYPSLGYNATLFNRRGKPVGSVSGGSEEEARAEAKRSWPGAVEKRVTGEGGVMREAYRSTGHEIPDPDYVIQVIYSNGVIAAELGEDDETKAIAEAKQALRAFGNDEYARVITRDGELVWDSRRDKGSRADWKRKYPGAGEARGVVHEARSSSLDRLPRLSWSEWKNVVIQDLRDHFATNDGERIFDRYEEELKQRFRNGDRPYDAAHNFAQVWRSEGMRESAIDPTSDYATVQRMIGFYVTQKGLGEYVHGSAVPMSGGVWQFHTRPFAGISAFRPRPGEARSGVERHEVTHAELARVWRSKGVSEARRSPFSVADLASRLSKAVGSTGLKQSRFGYQFSTLSPKYGQHVEVVVSTSDSKNVALDVYADKDLSNQYENLSTFLFGPDGYTSRTISVPAMKETVQDVWKIVDGYAASWEEGGDMEEAPRGRGKGKKGRFPHRHEDDLVRDPAYLPDAMAARYEQEFKKRGLQAEITDSQTTTPRGWEFGNITEATINGKAVYFKINVAQGEISGIANVDRSLQTTRQFFEVVSTARGSTVDQVISHLVSETADHLRPSVGEKKKSTKKKTKGRSRK